MGIYCGGNDYYPIRIGKISYPDNSAEYWKGCRDELIKVREKSQDDFEKYLNIFGSGGLLVGLTLLTKIVESEINYEFKLMLISGSVLFLVCLLSNLLSHYLVIDNCDRNIDDIDTQCPQLWENFHRRNNNLNYINWISLGLF